MIEIPKLAAKGDLTVESLEGLLIDMHYLKLYRDRLTLWIEEGK